MAPVYRLSELCTINLHDVSGFTKECYQEGSVPVIGSGMKPKGHHNLANVPKETILISRTGCYGQTSMYDTPVFVTNESYFLSDISPVVNKDFLFIFLREIAVDRLKKRNHYRSHKSLSFLKLCGQKIYVPPISEQHEIVEAYYQYYVEKNTSRFSERILKSIEKMQQIISEPSEKKCSISRLKKFVYFLLSVYLVVLFAFSLQNLQVYSGLANSFNLLHLFAVDKIIEPVIYGIQKIHEYILRNFPSRIILWRKMPITI